MIGPPCIFTFFFFNDTATTEIYTLSLHDALPISAKQTYLSVSIPESTMAHGILNSGIDRKSTRLNSSHQIISYAVFCLKKKKNKKKYELNLKLRRLSTRSDHVTEI